MIATTKSGIDIEMEVFDGRSSPPRIAVLFNSIENRTELLRAAALAGALPTLCRSFDELKQVVQNDPVGVIVCEDRVPQETFRRILDLTRQSTTPIPIVVASRTGEWEEFLLALRRGAFDYLVLPPQLHEVKRILALALRETVASNGDEKPSVVDQLSAARLLLYEFREHVGTAIGSARAALQEPSPIRYSK